MCVKYPSHLVFNQNHRISFPYTTHFVFAIIYTGLDPEIDIVGYDGGIDNYQNAYPMTRTFTFGVQLKF